ncbi:serine protease [Lysinibacter sp. HNR]|uniref:S1 family serine peptidase n=1 Tax=Lysinibacter sp. HNR TaxID=3031408 RepID=UPI0024360344|nr:serine protease [Lysinibacter sp. HNR]WGD37502.1 serine protease [Lysinibacter sp. HNR]
MRKPLIAGLASIAIALLTITTGSLSAQAQESPPSSVEEIEAISEADPYIIGGTNAAADQFPFMASIQYNKEHRCGGSLIGQDLILSAAHCFQSYIPGEYITDVKNRRVVVGSIDVSNKDLGQAREIRSISIQKSNDTALIRLTEPVHNIRPVQLPTPGTDALLTPGSLATAVGWGLTDWIMGASSSLLQHVNIPILSHEECEVTFENEAPGYFTDEYICAGKKGSGACNGDSGGPLVKKLKNGNYIQIGVVSRGAEPCAAQGSPGIFASTSAPDFGFLGNMTQIYPKLDPEPAQP